MISKLSRLWREPLLHFMLIGAALFVYYDLAGDNVEAPPKRIHVDSAQVRQLASNFQRTWSRAPNPEELQTMVESHVREEVFYREALAMGLDRDDPMVRRRLRMKLEFMLEDLATQDADDAVLDAYLLQNAAEFRTETEVSFLQAFLDPETRPQLEADAEDLLNRLNAGADPGALGDSTLIPRSFRRARESEIARQFGLEFAREIAQLAPGDWSGPFYSPFGAHLVKIEDRVDARLPALGEIRQRVLREYQADQRQQQKDLVYERLREGYEISVDLPAEASASIGQPKATQ
jgi:hypothetical protein